MNQQTATIDNLRDDMSRLSFDALVLQANLGAQETMTIKEIAAFVFGGGNPSHPDKVALARATRAACNLASLRRAEPIPSRKNITAIKSADKTGAVQAEARMNLMIRNDRRTGDDRRGSARSESTDRRATAATVVVPPAVAEVAAPEPTIESTVPALNWRRKVG